MNARGALFFLAGGLTVAGAVALALFEIEVAPTVGILMGLGILVIVFPHLPPIKLGLGDFTFETLAEQVKVLKQDVAGERASRSALQKLYEETPEERKSRFDSPMEDTQLGKFGGSSRVHGRELDATAVRIAGTDLATVTMRVRSTDPAKPLNGDVVFHLHETFAPEAVQIVPVNAAGIAQIEVVSYGAFTIGAECDGGRTRLEFDLKEAKGAFEPWIYR